MSYREDWPAHQPAAPEAPIPGRHWYSGCDPDRPRVSPHTGRCEGCGDEACITCGREDCPDHGSILYCAYGMNLDPSTMGWGRCEKVGKATLKDWAWHLRVFADVQPEPGASCEVGVWRIDAQQLRMLDGREGYRPDGSGMYDRATVTVTMEDGTEAEALIYYMSERMLGGLYTNDEAGYGYVEMVKRGREFFGIATDDLPTEEELEARWRAQHEEWA